MKRTWSWEGGVLGRGVGVLERLKSRGISSKINILITIITKIKIERILPCIGTDIRNSPLS